MVAWQRDSAFSVGPNGSRMEAYRYLVLGGVSQNWTHKCQNGNADDTSLGLAPCESGLWSTHVACKSLIPICVSNIPYTVHRSMPLACTGGLSMVHVGPKIWKMAENGQKCAHSWCDKIGYMSDLDQGML